MTDQDFGLGWCGFGRDYCGYIKSPFCPRPNCQDAARTINRLTTEVECRTEERDALLSDVANLNNNLEHQTAEVERLTRERDALLSVINAAKDCDMCGNIEECNKYPCYCINGGAFVFNGLRAANGATEGGVAQ